MFDESHFGSASNSDIAIKRIIKIDINLSTNIRLMICSFLFIRNPLNIFGSKFNIIRHFTIRLFILPK